MKAEKDLEAIRAAKILKEYKHLEDRRPGSQEFEVAKVDKDVDPDVELVLTLIKGIDLNLRNALTNAIMVGEVLIRKKNIIPYGQFTQYVETTFPIDIRTAQRWMKAHEFVQQNPIDPEKIKDLNDLYKLIEESKKQTVKIPAKPVEKYDFKLLRRRNAKGEAMNAKEKKALRKYFDDEIARIEKEAKDEITKLQSEKNTV